MVHQDVESRRKKEEVEEENGHIASEAVVEPYLTKNKMHYFP